MNSWCVDVKCKEEFLDPKSWISTLFPMLDHFEYTSNKEYIDNIEDFMEKFGANYGVLNADLDQELLLLVKVADDNIKQKPFLYAAQRLSAVQLLCIPFKELEKVEKIISPKVAHVKTLFILNTGRCGSTLLCKALDQLPKVQSISEPDVFSTLSLHYGNGELSLFPNAQVSKETLITVTRVATMLLNYYFLSRDPLKTNICYKQRSHVINDAEIIRDALPNAKKIYMYRNCLNFVESCTRLVTSSYTLYWFLSTLRLDALFLWWKYGQKKSWFYRYMGNRSEYVKVPFRHGFYWCFGFLWWANIQKALKVTQETPHFFSAVLKYEDLVDRKEETIFQIAESVGLLEDEKSRNNSVIFSAIANVFASNSQEGSVFASKRDLDSNDTWFGEWEKREINNVLQYLGGGVQDVNFTLPA